MVARRNLGLGTTNLPLKRQFWLRLQDQSYRWRHCNTDDLEQITARSLALGPDVESGVVFLQSHFLKHLQVPLDVAPFVLEPFGDQTGIEFLFQRKCQEAAEDMASMVSSRLW